MSEVPVRVVIIGDANDAALIAELFATPVSLPHQRPFLVHAVSDEIAASLLVGQPGDDIAIIHEDFARRDDWALVRRCVMPSIVLLDDEMEDIQAEACAEAHQAGAADCLAWNELSAGLLQRAVLYVLPANRAATNGSASRADKAASPATPAVLFHAVQQTPEALANEVQSNLSEGAETLRLLFDHLTDYIYVKDTQSRFLLVNKALASHLDTSPEELTGKTDFDFFHPDVAAAAFRDEKALLSSRLSELRTERAVIDRNGRRRWFNDLRIPLRDENDDVIGLVGLARDMTMEYEAQQKLRESEARYRTIIDNSQDVITVLEGDGTITYNSHALREVLGFEPDEVVGRSVFDFVHPDDLPEIQRTLATLVSECSSAPVSEFRFRRKDGSWCYFEAVAKALEENGVVRVISNSRDVSERRKSETALRESEERFRRLIDEAADAILISDENGCFVDVNRAACELLGYSREELLQLTPFDVARDVPPQIMRDLWKSAVPGQPITIQGLQYRKDGSSVPTEVHLSVYHMDEGLRILAIVRDITERIRAEQNLRDSEARYRMVLEHASEGILLFDRDGRCLETNSTMLEMFDYSAEELLQLRLHDLFTAQDQQQQPLRFDELQQGKVVRSERRARRKDGSELEVEISANLLPNGTFQAIIRDVSERKRNQMAIEGSELLFRTVVKNLGEGLLIADTNFTALYANPRVEQLLGYTPDELVGQDIIELLAPEHELDAMRVRQWQHSQGMNDQYEMQLHRKDGSLVWVLIHATSFKNAEGEIAGVLCAIIDINERKQAEAQQQALTTGMEAVLAAADRLLTCPDLDQLLCSAVELAREKLGFERTGLFLQDETTGVFYGTYGTDLQGHTVSEKEELITQEGARAGIIEPLENANSRWITQPLGSYEGE
ncbi:MAG TPA: PAS domain S-box protein, partial [Abditibacteriaceae bacterium]